MNVFVIEATRNIVRSFAGAPLRTSETPKVEALIVLPFDDAELHAWNEGALHALLCQSHQLAHATVKRRRWPP